MAEFPDATGAVARLSDAGRWARYTPEVREAVLTVLTSRAATVRLLLEALDRGDVAVSALGPSRRRRLEQHRDDAIRERATALFAAVPASTGRDAYERLRPAVESLTGVASRGAPLFATHCRACHTFNGQGGAIGPDLSGLRSQTADAILRHVLVPDAEITAGFEAYTVEFRDGRALAGRIESEAPQSLTLRDAASAVHTVLRADVASISALPGSLMPAGFDQALSAQELADLIAFLLAPGRQ
jgi:putative heme-binding domain-containing protein